MKSRFLMLLAASIAVAAAVVNGLPATASSSQPSAYLVRNINTQPIGSNPEGFVALGKKVLFEAQSTPNSSGDLWVTDGTSAGTHELSLSRSYGDLLQAVRAGNEVYFRGETPDRVGQLWKTNGTQAGTRVVKTFTAPNGGPDNLTAVGSELFFETSNQYTGALWRSDGTAKGTKFMRTILLGPGSGYHFNLPGLTAVGNDVYFAAYTKATGRELWKSNGTAAGTVPVKDIRPGPADSNVQPLAVVGNVFYFSANDGSHGDELWKTDGTAAGTIMVKNIAPDSPSLGIQSSDPSQMTVAGKEMFFFACSRVGSNRTRCGRGGGRPNEIWKSDGTAAGTVEVKQISVIEGLTYLGNDAQGKPRILFLGWDHVNGDQMWSTDGTLAGTQIIKGAPGASYLTPIVSGPHPLALFVGFASRSHSQLWATDGTSAGTHVVANVDPAFLTPATLGGRAGLIFSGANPAASSQPWFSDGTAAGTKMITRISQGDMGSNPDELIAFRGKLLFSLAPGIGDGPPGPLPPTKLYVSDGTFAGTQPLKAIPFAGSETQVGRFLVFFTEQFHSEGGLFHYQYRYRLWRTDGTGTGTTQFAPARDGYFNWSPNAVISAGNRAFIITSNNQLWVTNGTLSGTRRVESFSSVQWGSAVVYRHELYFGAARGDHSSGLWRSDGAATGTVLVKGHLKAKGNASSIVDMVAGPKGVFFVSRKSTKAPSRLWSTTGIAGGARLIRSFPAGVDPPSELTTADARIFFVANDGRHGDELWSSDGTAAGTAMVRDIYPGKHSSNPGVLTAIGSELYFQAGDSRHGVEPWKSNGSRSGTVMIRDIWPGPKSSNPSEFTGFEGKVYFTAADPKHGTELWSTNGSRAGTRLVRDIYPGPESSFPYSLTVAGNHLFFGATDPLHGTELWAIK